MDDFVRNKLTEWGFSELIEKFKDEGIDTESLYVLEDQEIADLISKVGPRAKFKNKLKLLKEQNSTNLVPVNSPAQVFPSTSDTSDKGKRKLDFPGESSKSPTRKRRHDTTTEETILCEVKNIMNIVQQKIPNQDNKLNTFLKKKIRDLETDKREMVGVFGKTGAGKSSLINAVIGVKNLLPSGSVSACTSVMIKVEDNKLNQYQADIEFITKEEWKDELWSMLNFLRDNADQQRSDEEQDDFRDTVEKLSALYGEEWENKSLENLMDNKYFKEIQEFVHLKKKTLTCETAKGLAAKFAKYTTSNSKDGEVKRYWPLVKCVTIKVPNNDLLQHVTLVDLPGNGDRNKSRDKMWKQVVGSCSTVWVVTEINRAADEKEAWEILKSACSVMGNGGECQRIHFICTKSDDVKGLESDDRSRNVHALILKNNEEAKEEVTKRFSQYTMFKKHFNDGCFKVFTVSSIEFLRKKHLESDETEIPKLQTFLKDLNDCHSETLNYVSGAFGILSLIQGARRQVGADKRTDVYTELEERLNHELDEVRKPMHETYEAFEKCLSEGVEKSNRSWEKVLKSVLHSTKVKGGAFHKILKCVVENNGTHVTKKKKEINLNKKLASCLTDSIDEEFKKTFPNDGKCGPINGALNRFSLDTKKLIEKYKDVELQLIFLKTEVEKVKTKLIKVIRERKKTIYNSLTTTIGETMQECYDEAARFCGKGSLKNMRDTIEKHVRDSKNIMFERAKDEMMNQLRDLMEEILDTLEKTMLESIELSLKTDGNSIPDVTEELQKVTSHYKELEFKEPSQA